MTLIRIQSIIQNAINRENGWTKLNGHSRTIKIGNRMNCNGDCVYKDLTILPDLQCLMALHNINDYRINNIDTKFEFAYELILTESIYQELSNKINNKINNEKNYNNTDKNIITEEKCAVAV